MALWKNLQKHGRPRLIDARKSRLLIRKSNDRPKMTVRQLLVELRLNKICSIDTVKRQLRRNGLFGRVAAIKPLLTQKHVIKRTWWCEDKASWTIAQWNKVIFSDECKIELNQNMDNTSEENLAHLISVEMFLQQQNSIAALWYGALYEVMVQKC